MMQNILISNKQKKITSHIRLETLMWQIFRPLKGRVRPITGLEGPEGEQKYSTTHLWPWRYKGWVVSTTSRTLYPREITGTHCTAGWGGPQRQSGRVYLDYWN
jgi:hypothetical protein